MCIRFGAIGRTIFLCFLRIVFAALLPLSAFAQAPVLSSRPLTKVVTVGQPISFAVTATGANLTYQWKHNGQAVAGATTATLTIPATTYTDKGWYQVSVTNASGTVKSLAFLTVAPAASALVAWPNAAVLPAGLSTTVALAGGQTHALALKADGTVVSWATTYFSLLDVPAGLSGVVAIAAGDDISAALKSDGTVVVWGRNYEGETTFPSGLTDVVAIAAGGYHFLALKADGTVLAWGDRSSSATTVPAGLSDVVGIATGSGHGLAVKADGSVVAWPSGGGDTATIVPAGLTNVTTIAAGNDNSIAVKADGTVVGWGNFYPTHVPDGLSGVTAVAAKTNNGLAVKTDGTVAWWGGNGIGNPVTAPAGLNQVFAIAVSGYEGLAAVALATPVITTTPVTQTGVTGQSARFSVTLADPTSVTYQWTKNGSALTDGGNISGSTTANLVIDPVGTADAGSYAVILTNPAGTLTSAAVPLTIIVAPVIVTRPLSRLASVGQTLSLSVTATDSGPLTYQWHHNSRTIPGATASTLTIPNITQADRGTYDVLVSNAAASSRSVLQLNVVNFTLNSPRLVAWSPTLSGTYVQAQVSSAFDVVSFTSSVGVRSDGTVTQWNFAGDPVVNLGFVAVSSSSSHILGLRADGTPTAWGNPSTATPLWSPPPGLHDIVAISAGDVFDMAVKADGSVVAWSSSLGTVTTPPAGLSDVIAVSQSSDVLALKGDGTVVSWGTLVAPVPAGLSGVVAISAGPYVDAALKADGTVVLWGVNTSGQLDVPAGLTNVVGISVAGTQCIATKADGTVVVWGFFRNRFKAPPPEGLREVVAAGETTDVFVVLANTAVPSFLTQPVGQVLNVGQSTTLSAVARGVPLPTYRWQKGGVDLVDGGALSGTATTQLTITNAQLSDSGDYTLVATNSLASTVSSVASVTVATPPSLASWPLSRRQKLGDAVTFSVAPVAGTTATYQWKHNGQTISGATTSTLALAAVTTTDQGFYEVAVTNLAGGVTRTYTQLTVAKPSQTVRVWGSGGTYSSIGPVANSSHVAAISSGVNSDLALLDDGTVTGWGTNYYGEAVAPADLANVVSIAAGDGYSLALLGDGTVRNWGTNPTGVTTVPSGLNNVIAVTAASGRAFAVKADGTVTVWGYTTNYDSGEVPKLRDVVSVVATPYYGLALKNDGTVVSWGSLTTTQLPPAGLSGVVALSQGNGYTLALRADGTVVGWGDPGAAHTSIPSGLTNAIAIAAGRSQGLILKADGSILSLPSTALIPAGLANVSAIASNNDNIAIIPAVAPSLTTPLANQAVAPGATATFSASVAGTAPYTFQWTRNGTLIPGATAATFIVSNVQFADTGNYAVTITNAFGSVTSPTATLGGINPAPTITTAPQGASVAIGQTLSLSVAVTGVGPFTYRWRRNGIDVPGATGATLSLGAATLAMNGAYDVVIADGLSVTTSVPVIVQVAPSAYPQVMAPDPIASAAFEQAGGLVYGFVRGPGGRVLTFGSFSRAHGAAGRNLAWLKADGSGDTPLVPLVIDGPITAAALQSDGKIVVGGTFGSIGGQTRAGLARLNADGTLDLTFAPTGDFTGVYALAVQPTGKIVVSGAFAARLARVNADGSADTTFAPAPSSVVYAIVALADNRLVVGGAFTQIAGQARSALASLNNDGSIDASFSMGTGFNGPVYALHTASASRIVVGGGFTSYNGSTAGRIVRLTANGAIDNGWSTGTGFNSSVYAVDVQSNDQVVAAGAFGGFNGVGVTAVARLLATGALETVSRNLVFSQAASAVTYLDNGYIVAGGSFTLNIGFNTAYGIALISPVGVINSSYLPGLMLPATVNKVARLADGQVIAGGDFSYVNGTAKPYLARLSAAGVLDSTFTNQFGRPSSPVTDLVVQPDGKVVTGGGANTMTRLNANGSLDAAFPLAEFFGNPPDRVLQMPDGRYLVAFTNAASATNPVPHRDTLRVLRADGANDNTFAMTTLPAGTINALVVQVDGKIVVGGSFRSFNGAPCDYLVRLLPTGVRDASFTARTDDVVTALALQPDGRLLLAGDFQAVNDVVRARVARLLATGEMDPTFTPQFTLNAAPTLLRLQPDGRVLLSGAFDNVSNLPGVRYLIRAMPGGAYDSSLSAPGLGSAVNDLAFTDDGSLWLAGGELQLGGFARSGLVKATSTPGPVIVTQPTGGIALAGQSGSFTFTVAGGAGVTYQWFKDDVALPGATNPTFTLNGVQPGDAGSYTARATSSTGTLTSTAAVLTVSASAPVLASGDITGFGGAIKNGSRWSLAAPAIVAGSSPITYQWSRNGTSINGATNRTFWDPNWQSADAGTYSVTLNNGTGSVTTNAFPQFVADTPDWNWSVPQPQGNSLFAMAYLNGRFVGGGSRGTIVTSTDGQAWSTIRLGVSNSVFGIAQGNGVYVALTSYGGLWSSADASLWTQRDAGVGADGRYFSSLTFGAGRFVAVGDRGLVATSPDGVTWSAVAGFTTDSLTTVAAGGGKFVALGSGGRTFVSADGLAWSAGPTLRRPVNVLAYGAGRFVAASGKQLFVSADAQTWTQQTLDTTASVVSLQSTDVGFLAALDSTDGKYWSSTDGLAWSVQSIGYTQTAAAATAFTHGGGRYVRIGPAPESLFTSPNLTDWIGVTPSAAHGLVAVAAGADGVVAIGQNGYVKLMPDGTLSRVTTSLNSQQPTGLAYAGGTYMAVFADGEKWTSSNGISWSSVTNSSQSYSGVSFANDGFYVFSPTGLIYTPGGATINTGTGQALYKTVYGAGVYVTIGANGTLLSSPNGTTWTIRSPNGISTNILDIVYAAGKFILVSEGASIRTSPDGITWTAQTNPLATGLKSLAVAGGKIYAFTTGNTDYLTSTDGITWTPGQHGNANPTVGAAVLGNTLYLFAANGTISSASVAAPVISTPPVALNKAVGETATFTVALSGAGPFAYQWLKNGVAIPGANFATLVLSPVTASDAGNYAVSVTSLGGSTTTTAVSLTVESRGLINSSALGRIGSGQTAFMGVFTIEGASPKQMLIRAVGPTLADFGVLGTLADPQLVIEDLATGAVVASNDDWGTAANAAQVVSATLQAGAVPLGNGSKDAAVLATFAPGSYRIRVTGPGASTGVVTIDIFDADTVPRLVYLGTLTQVSAGTGVLTQGFTLAAVTANRSYLIRAIGPSLGLPGALSDPKLTVSSNGTPVAGNDDWAGDSAVIALTSAVGAMPLPAGSKDAALAFTPSAAKPYTAQVSSPTGATGMVLLELFESDPLRATSVPLVVVSAPADTTVNAGQPVSFGVVAVAKPAAMFQWSKNGVPIAGATNPLLTLPSTQTTDAGTYAVFVSNGGATAFNSSATLTVNPLNNATHAALGGGYVPGGAVSITNALYYVGGVTGLEWSVTLPPGWSFLSDGGAAGDVKPATGATGVLTWKWTTPPASPATFTYTVLVPGSENSPRQLSAGAIVTTGTSQQAVAVVPAPLTIRPIHSADTDGDGRIGLFELTRVIELYNTRSGSVRTGRYRLQVGSEDGFTADLVTASGASVSLAYSHSADTDHDARISLVELTRVIELYNTRSGSARTGAYHIQAGTEDGFGAGP